MIYDPNQSVSMEMLSIWNLIISVKEIILFVCSLIAAIGVIKILRKQAKPHLVNEELFIKKSDEGYAHVFLFRCIIRNNGSKLCSVESLGVKFGDDVSYRKVGAVNIRSDVEQERGITSTKLPVNIPPEDGAKKLILIGHFRNKKKCLTEGKVEIKFSGKTKPISRTVAVSEENIITDYGAEHILKR